MEMTIAEQINWKYKLNEKFFCKLIEQKFTEIWKIPFGIYSSLVLFYLLSSLYLFNKTFFSLFLFPRGSLILKSDLCRFVHSICIHFLSSVSSSSSEIVSMCICKMLSWERTYLLEINWFLLHYLFPIYIVNVILLKEDFHRCANGDIRKLKFERNWHRWYIARERD